MVTLSQLWLPIVLAAVFVFIVSFVVHMVLKYHNSDYKGLANEDDVRAAITKTGAGPGQYLIPYCPDPKERAKPEVKRKFTEGPVGMLALRSPGDIKLGPFLIQWFIFLLVISFFTAYVTSRTVAPGTQYLAVFRVAGTVGFLAYSGAQAQDSIWMGKPWGITVKNILDGLLYGLVTAGTFGWLWPR